MHYTVHSLIRTKQQNCFMVDNFDIINLY
jgi:hypothetical protein